MHALSPAPVDVVPNGAGRTHHATPTRRAASARAWRLHAIAVLCVAVMLPSGGDHAAVAVAPAPPSWVPQVRVYSESAEMLRSFVLGAYRGECSQQELRSARIALESALANEIGRMAVEFVPGDRRAMDEARAAFHQQVMRSQEWEYFGPVPQPEWGWDPTRVASSEGISLRVEDSVTVIESVTPGVVISWR